MVPAGETVVLYSVLLGAVRSHVLQWPGQLPGRASVISYKWGAAGWGEKYMFMFDGSCFTMPPPPRGPTWTA
jgi:hypothetical protein